MDINLAVLIVGSVTVIGLIQFLTWAVMIITHHNFDYLDPTLKLAARGGPVHDGSDHFQRWCSSSPDTNTIAPRMRKKADVA